MVESIMKAIAAVLHTAFPNAAIYTEDVPQGFTAPCFFIMLLNSTQKPRLGYRFYQDYFFDVQYFPENQSRANAEIQNMALELYDNLEFIPWEKRLLKGIDMRHEQQEGMLHFFITFYAAGERERERLANMEDLTIKERVKKHGRKD